MDLPPNVDSPPNPPVAAYVSQYEPECVYLTQTQAQVALTRLQAQLPSTSFTHAAPSEICGLVKVEMASGSTVYTDPTGRYLLLTFAFDTHQGSPADVSQQLEVQIERRQTYPDTPIPGAPKGREPIEPSLNFIKK